MKSDNLSKFLMLILLTFPVLFWTSGLVLGFDGDFGNKGYESGKAILIKSNKDFKSIAGITGDGTQDNPYVIPGYFIPVSKNSGVYIENTSAYFILKDFQIYAQHDQEKEDVRGVFFKDVKNGTIDNFIVKGFNGEGIYLVGSQNVSVKNSKITNINSRGILVESSTNVAIVYNEVAYTLRRGIYVKSRSDISDITIRGNHVHHIARPDAGGEGIEVRGNLARKITIDGNEVHDVNDDGIEFIRVHDSIITNNSTYNNTGQGIELFNHSNNNIISNNFVFKNQGSGIIITNSRENKLINNIVFYNSPCGIAFVPKNKFGEDSSVDNLVYGLSPWSNGCEEKSGSRDIGGKLKENTIIYAGDVNVAQTIQMPITSRNQVYVTSKSEIKRVSFYLGARKLEAKAELDDGIMLWAEKAIPVTVKMEIEPINGILTYEIKKADGYNVSMKLAREKGSGDVHIKFYPAVLFGNPPRHNDEYEIYIDNIHLYTLKAKDVDFKFNLDKGTKEIVIKPKQK